MSFRLVPEMKKRTAIAFVLKIDKLLFTRELKKG